MAKKIVRGITDVKTINNQDFDTNNVNDLLSDGQYNYIHRKKGKNEEYHNLTDNIKTISSDNTELLTVTNNNKTTNTATLHPKHDNQKEQVLESTRNTVTINHGTNGTDEKTSVDTNPQKVLEHENLMAGDGLKVHHDNSTSTINIEPTSNGNPLNNGFYMGNLINDNTSSSIISLQTENNRIVQLAFRESAVSPNLMIMRYRFVNEGTPTDWKLATIDNEQLSSLLARKEQVLESTRKTIAINRGEKTTVDVNFEKVQEKLTAGDGITIQGNTISASAPVDGATESIQGFSTPGEFNAYKHVVTIGQKTLTTFSFECFTETAEHVISGELKEELGKFIGPGYSVSSGSLSISHEVDVIKLLNTTPERHNNQHGTFTFYRKTSSGGGDVPPSV